MTLTTLSGFPSVDSPESSAVRHAAIQAVAYADIFDYPLRATEVQRYLHRVPATLEATAAVLEDCIASGGPLSCRDGFYTLRGREALVKERPHRSLRAEKMWPAALRFGRLIGALPFVRMVAITGSLAWDNVHGEGDIDYLVVTEPERLWLCRGFAKAVVRIARLAGVPLCLNYVISERALALAERNLYVAYELARMTPVAGFPTYDRMRRLNSWSQAHLPNAGGSPVESGKARRARRWLAGAVAPLTRLVEMALRTRVGGALERLEMKHRMHRIRRLVKNENAWIEVAYDVDHYKPHTEAHQHWTLAAFAERLSRLSSPSP